PLFDVQNESSSRESADTAEGARGYEGGFYRGSRDMPPSSSIHSTSFSLGAAVPSYWRSPMSHRLTSSCIALAVWAAWAALVGTPAPGVAQTAAPSGSAAADDLSRRLDAAIAKSVPEIVLLRHQIHEHPELGNREEKTAALVADHLRKLGLK